MVVRLWTQDTTPAGSSSGRDTPHQLGGGREGGGSGIGTGGNARDYVDSATGSSSSTLSGMFTTGGNYNHHQTTGPSSSSSQESAIPAGNWFSPSSFSLNTLYADSTSTNTATSSNPSTSYDPNPSHVATRTTTTTTTASVSHSSTPLSIDGHTLNTPTTTTDAQQPQQSYTSWFSAPWNQANESLNYAAEATYSTLAGAVSSFYKESNYHDYSPMESALPRSSNASWSSSSSLEDSSADLPSSSSIIVSLQRRQERQGQRQLRRRATSRTNPSSSSSNRTGRRPSITFGGGGNSSSSDTVLDWTSTLLRNPYQSVRGRHTAHRHQSMSAIRSFINLVPDVHPPLETSLFQEPEQEEPRFARNTSTSLRSVAVPGQSSSLPSLPNNNNNPVTGGGGDNNLETPVGLPLGDEMGTDHDQETTNTTTPSGWKRKSSSRGGTTHTSSSVHPPPLPRESSSLLTAADEGSWSEAPPLCLEDDDDEEVLHQRPIAPPLRRRDRPPHRNLQARANATAETAAHLAEGTIRAWRDLALEEAVELNSALRFWSLRWEHPGWSFLEAGPLVWMSEGGYNHRRVGKLVAQSQAVLARRCAAIGELQQHLLHAGWQRGVAQWGVLGQGGHWWAQVAPGFDGSIQPEEEFESIPPPPPPPQPMPQEQESFPPTTSNMPGPGGAASRQRDLDDTDPGMIRETSSGSSLNRTPVVSDGEGNESRSSGRQSLTCIRQGQSHKLSSKLGRIPSKHESTNDLKRGLGGDVHVRNRDGGGTFVDDPLFLAKWSVDAIALVRRQLNRASNGTVSLPFESNWNGSATDQYDNESHESPTRAVDDSFVAPPTSLRKNAALPTWALDAGPVRTAEGMTPGMEQTPGTSRVVIADLPALTEEVSELLNAMEDVMDIQRQRRLERLQPPNWWRRNWFFLAPSIPFAIWLVRHGRFRILISSLVRSVKYFVVTRIQAPVMAIFDEIWKGRTSFSDKKARMESIEVLKKMIKSWLDDTHPGMPDTQRQSLADAMDVTLVEEMKEEYMKSLGLNTLEVVRMSFIEMQWLKKEMMNALHAMDEVMSANDINMNLAAITPVFMIVYVETRIIRYLFYALLRLGKSREETYASFRSIVLDIERLLVMRDNPPDTRCVAPVNTKASHNPSVLGADDLGMLMLLIHECRTIMWRERRRFNDEMIRSVNEDLSELAGERGAVSIKQQLQIVARMTRSYPFLKVISTGHFFEHHSQLRRQ